MSIEKPTELKIFVAYTSEGETEHNCLRNIVSEDLSITEIRRYFEVSIDVFDWSQVFPDAGRPQSLINAAIKNFDPDWIVFIFWHRFESDAGWGKTGIEEEWALSLEMKERGQGRPYVTAYFNEEEPPAFQVDESQLSDLQDFKSKVFSEHEALASKFCGTHDFEKKFRGHLTHRLLSNQNPAVDEKYNLRHELMSASRALLSWPSSLSNGKWIDRPEFQRIHQKIESETSSTTLILGEPGSGKSALLAKIGNRLAEGGVSTLAIKADFLSRDIANQDQLGEALNLSLSPQNCLLAIATSEPVVLLIDQLDALADLVDLHSGRLDVFLNLIHSLVDQKNVHIVTSCRTFEQDHDPRLRGLDLESVILECPSWEVVSGVLKENSINAEGWPADYQETLRTPQNLKIFLDINTGGGEHDSARSYHTLLDKLWKEKVLSDPENRPKLLEDMAIKMGEREELWLPIIHSEADLKTIKALISEDILVRTDDEKKICFRHQTFFEYARARAFIKREGSLSSTVFSRQDAFFIRPLLWNALRYLREADCPSYLREFELLWNDQTLRPHIKSLLIDFLGQLPQPNDREEMCLISELKKNKSNRYILSSVTGSHGWFLRLEKHYLPMLMNLPANEAINVLGLLIEAWKVSKDKVFKLLETYWLTDQSKDNLTWRLLGGLSEWTEKPIDICCQILERSDIDASAINDYASRVSAVLPDEAPRIVATYLRRKLKLARQQVVEAPPVLPEDPTVDQQAVFYLYNKNKHIEKLLESETNFYDLPAIAESAPRSFLKQLWSWFIDIFQQLAQNPHPFVIGYRDDYSLSTDLLDGDSHVHFEQTLMNSLQMAIKKVIESDPDYFLAVLEKWKNEDLLVVQRLFAKGLLNFCRDQPGRIFEFLCYDLRRLKLGDRHDCHLDSKKLISAVTPFLDASQLLQLEQHIENWSYYYGNPDSDDAQVRFDRIKWNRQHRLRLWRAFPKKYLSRERKAHIGEEERAFSDLQDWDIQDMQGGFIGSPISLEQMKKNTDTQLLEVFSEITDRTGSHHPREWMRGGIEQLAPVFLAMAKESPERVICLIEQMFPETNDKAVGKAIEGFAESNLSQTNKKNRLTWF